jgi:hypothetical protein
MTVPCNSAAYLQFLGKGRRKSKTAQLRGNVKEHPDEEHLPPALCTTAVSSSLKEMHRRFSAAPPSAKYAGQGLPAHRWHLRHWPDRGPASGWPKLAGLTLQRRELAFAMFHVGWRCLLRKVKKRRDR